MRHGVLVAYLDAGAEDKIKEIIEVSCELTLLLLFSTSTTNRAPSRQFLQVAVYISGTNVVVIVNTVSYALRCL